MVYADGSLGYGFGIKGMDISCLPNESVNAIASQLEGLLCSVAEGWKIQLYYRFYPKEEDLLTKHAEISKDAPEGYAPLRQSRLAFLRGREFFVPKIYLFLRSRVHRFSKRRFWEGEKRFAAISLEEFKEHEQKCLKARNRFFSSLERARLAPKPLTSKGWFCRPIRIPEP